MTEATEKRTRKRIDVDALASENPQEKLIITLPVPAEMRVLVRQAAENAEVSEAQFIRDLVASQIGYTVPASFNERKRRVSTSGLTEDERKALQKQQNEEKRANVNKMLAAIASGLIDTSTLESLGIDITKLPKPRKAGDDENDDE